MSLVYKNTHLKWIHKKAKLLGNGITVLPILEDNASLPKLVYQFALPQNFMEVSVVLCSYFRLLVFLKQFKLYAVFNEYEQKGKFGISILVH